jgi:diaminopimelate epimerase
LYRFIAVDGEHDALCNADGSVSLKMQDVAAIRKDGTDHVLNTGSPHFVQVTGGVKELDVFKRGREIRNREEFREKGINVNFIEPLERPNTISVRTYERGVEDETLSCGTGVTAAAIVSSYGEGFNKVEVETPGGRLRVEYEKQGDKYHNIWLTGPAVKVFEGEIQLP